MKRILIVGAGHVGFYVADRLSHKLRGDIRRGDVEVMVVDPQQHMTYQPFLPEAAAGHISPRHGVIPLRRALKRCRIVAGAVTRITHADKTVTVQPIVGPPRDITYDHIVVAPGSVSRTLPIPGLAECAVGFKTMGEAIFLRNHVLQRLDVAAATTDEEVRRKALSFVFIGGGFAGVEAMAELEDMCRDVIEDYEELSPDQLRWTLVEASQKILPEVGPEMGVYAVERLIKRGLDIRLNTLLKSCVDGHIVLSDGEEFDADTIVWTAGVKPHPMLTATDLPLGPKGHLLCDPTLRVHDDNGILQGAWGAGDSAQVPDLSGFTEYCAPNAQHAVRQAATLADNIRAELYGREPKQYKHKYVGSVASLGLHKGVAHVYGIKGKGLFAWFMHRSYHLLRVPGLGRKTRVVADWTLALFTKRETVQLGELHDPRKPFEEIASGKSLDGDVG
ncbi:NAD(P)/FAD-dependent oxidoreductase [Stackebrandtia nassauensis]|uniref:FAD-dependent pyridine nucleotide-disulfide oxidoreductase n=1 Tax=Stackebrandtia nassauensis (strain DSM 44728 / CIP 108903 / NRRL B-16338 / NBRC 102104 / LLR-40K-21) TaxID=446470 RepID=D3PWD8_STANL|nr:NAD(P)/FAD-dependent oxidoreductase [Stackebrandtia nassauensis]ADD41295.1 FAD-dependent pyridine nucleotide-disulfide oxidoreductase [Stackebrandtia nassauensis DSM 44728]